MSNDLETFNYFVDDLLSSDTDLLKYELDYLLMQYLFNSNNLELFKIIGFQEDLNIAS